MVSKQLETKQDKSTGKTNCFALTQHDTVSDNEQFVTTATPEVANPPVVSPFAVLCFEPSSSVQSCSPCSQKKAESGVFFSSNTLNPCTSFSFRDLGRMLSARQARFPTEGRAYLRCGSCEGAAVWGGGAGGSRAFGERLLHPELCRAGAKHVSPLTGHGRALPAPRSPPGTPRPWPNLLAVG